MIDWTDERIATLKKLWAEGMSANQVADEMGGGISRSAVLGKIHRLGLSGRTSTSRLKFKRNKPGSRVGGVISAHILDRDFEDTGYPEAPAKPRASKTATARDKAAAPGKCGGGSPSLPPATPYVELVDDVVIPVGERKGLTDLENGDCRWPIGDVRKPDFHFCAKDQVPGMPYCQAHTIRAYQPRAAAKPSQAIPDRVFTFDGISPELAKIAARNETEDA